jgi:cytochrome b pre-mRNA-processing protein 3
MIPPLFRRSSKATIAALYGAIVAQARSEHFYRAYGVADTVLGRFDMIVLHAALLLRRMRAGDAAMQALAQGVFDAFCLDIDHNLREMGISDQGVPRQMRRVGEAFYGRARAYEAALAQGDDAMLAGALARNVYADVTEAQVAAPHLAAVAAPRLAAYVRQAVAALDSQELAAIARGVLRFPEPTPIAAIAELNA